MQRHLTTTTTTTSPEDLVSAMGKGPLERQLQFEKKNQNLVKLPKYATVEKRPIPHAAVASPYAGASVPKIVYVSSKTPFMSAVKRVQKLLRQVEKRVTAGVSLEDHRKSEKQKLAELATVAPEQREEVFVKATGRAIEKTLNVGKWFEERGAEYAVRVKTGSVLVVDDVAEDEEKKQREMQKRQREEEGKQHTEAATSQLSTETNQTASASANSAAKKRKRTPDAASEDVDLPEARTRWVKMVEVAVSLK